MSDAPPPPPPSPGRRPFGIVRLTAPIAAVPTGRSVPLPRAGRWYGPRVPLPPLSIDALRDSDLAP
ncbi:hypothetical protein B7P34_22960 [Streptosporangium nondiastaticum]|uniref:Uncharacterized protein n=2 Tax=Actinomycetes TaxID=1760 RepID=A0A3B0BS04_9ACTN|nr:hypothetical protein [Streptomyces sp. NRRL B-1677]PSJ26410.1 hypothetical protein B7P34_22960 [Streptosporangium nondiastaticum]RKN75184.1 hypothetical protein D7231_06900 [Streptomyces klenkii]